MSTSNTNVKMSKPYFPNTTPECFQYSAIAHHHKNISTSEYFDNILSHLRGIRHPEDESPTKTGMMAISDPLGMLIQDACLFEPDFIIVEDTKEIKNLLIDCWTGTLGNVKQQAVSLLESLKSHGISQYILKMMICIACIRGNPSLLEYCLTLDNFSAEVVEAAFIPLQRIVFNDLVPDVKIWKLLLDNGFCLDKDGTFSPGINNNSQKTMAYFAVKALGDGLPHTLLLDFLFQRGLVLDNTLIDSAAAKGYPELMQYLISKSDSQPKDDQALLTAVYSNNMLMVESLINAGLNVNYHPRRDRAFNPFDFRPSDTPLHAAAERGNIGMVKLLLENGASKEVHDDGGQTAVRRAEDFGHSDVAEFIRSWKL